MGNKGNMGNMGNMGELDALFTNVTSYKEHVYVVLRNRIVSAPTPF